MLVSNIRLSYLKNGVWSSFTNQAENTMDGIKIQTNPNSSYYLKYRTWNEGRSDYYPYVTSTEDDFAGLSGRPIQRLQIQVYKNDGTKLTSGVVVMYRVKNGDQWIPWVSNADPEWMRSVQQKYNLGGTLAVDSVYAGNPGQNITGVQILVYEEGSLGDFTGGEVSASLSYMVGSLSNWSPFSKGALAPQMDGIKIQTSASKDYYLLYKMWNAGNSSYYPTVKSTEDDYAGYPGKAIQRLAIQVFRNDGTKLTSGVIVMYRAFAEGEWLPWVSNADPEWMRNAQNKYSLGGTLDVDSVYAGNAGQNISGVEIRIFEDDSYNAGSDNFSGSEINLNLSYMSDSLSNWTPFSRSVVSSDIDGIKIQTDSSQPFYLQYKSWNEGRSSYYPVVDSRGTAYNDYAGYPGQTMQLLSISAYSNDGTKLTSGVVIMYRVRVAGVWLPWVSNADPEWMQSVFRQYNLDGTLDTVSTYAGNKGQNIDGVEIRAFTGTTNNNPVGNLSGTEYVPSLSYMNDSLSNWTPFSGSVISSKLDGIKIQTDPSKPYYLVYKSWNAGRSGYYPDVDSRGTAYNDYAGYPGQPTQLLSIKVYRNDGVKLTTGVVVMYRVHIGDSWIPWVSNADPEWMRSVQNKYGLGGVLDYDAYYAGNKGQNINGIEIRIFEENGISDTPPTPSGPCKIIQAPFISQLGRYPTGCESVSSVMALNYAGFDISVDTFIDKYLDKRPWPFDPNVSFGGNPRLNSGWGCYTPVIKKAMDRILSGKSHYAKELKGLSIPTLCSKYIDKDIPVIFWGTINMKSPHASSSWVYNGKTITWIAPLHCLLLVGYDDNNYIFNDPLTTRALTYYNKESVEAAYNGVYKQAIVILENPNQPPFDHTNYEALKNELVPAVENDIDWLHKLGKWHSSEDALDIILSYDDIITKYSNRFDIPKALLQTVIFREQRFVWFADDVADSIVIQSYFYDKALDDWQALSPAQQLVTPLPEIPIGYRHDCSTGLAQIFGATAIKAINYAVLQGIITDERSYNAENLEDLKTIWYKLKDDDDFNVKCAALTLIFEARSTLGYSEDYQNYNMDQIAMIFTKYNSISDLPNDYGKDCAKWFTIFNKYN